MNVSLEQTRSIVRNFLEGSLGAQQKGSDRQSIEFGLQGVDNRKPRSVSLSFSTGR